VKKSVRKIFLAVGLILAVLVYAFLKFFGLAVLNISSPGDHEGHLVSKGERRSYEYHVPETYDPRQPTALVISLHGYSSKPSDIEFTSRWNDLADREGFITVFPLGAGSPSRWRSAPSYSQLGDAQMDVQFIANLIDRLSRNFNIDPTRIYLDGISNGGGMSLAIACNLSDRIAAFGSVAGAYVYPLEKCNPARPFPFIAFHGNQDPIIPYRGGINYSTVYPDVPRLMQELSKLNQCRQGTEKPFTGEIGSTSYTRCLQDAEVVLYTIDGGGHTWPGDPSSTDSDQWGYTTHQIDATAVMWQFFQSHPMVPQT